MQPIPASAKEATPGITTGQEVAFDTSQFTTKQQADFVTDPGAPLAQMGVVQITTLPRDPASTPSSFTEVKRDLTGVTSYKGGYTNGKVTGDIAVAGGIISAKLVPSSGERTIVVLARPVGGDAGIPAILSIIASLQ